MSLDPKSAQDTTYDPALPNDSPATTVEQNEPRGRTESQSRSYRTVNPRQSEVKSLQAAALSGAPFPQRLFVAHRWDIGVKVRSRFSLVQVSWRQHG